MFFSWHIVPVRAGSLALGRDRRLKPPSNSTRVKGYWVELTGGRSMLTQAEGGWVSVELQKMLLKTSFFIFF